MSQYRTERFRGLDWSLGLLGVSGQGEGACYPLTSSRPLQWYRCWIKVASRAEHPVLRDWPFEESSLSSATTSGMLVGLREKWNQPHPTPKSTHHLLVIKSLLLLSFPHPEWKNNMKTQTIDKFTEDLGRTKLSPAMSNTGLYSQSTFCYLC